MPQSHGYISRLQFILLLNEEKIKNGTNSEDKLSESMD